MNVKQIVIEGKGKIEIFHFQQESVDGEKKGALFFVGQISHTTNPRDSLYYLLNSLAATLKREYYSPALSQHAKAFEIALKKANDILLTLSEESRNNLELSILIFRKNQVSFSVIGNSEILLIRDEELFTLSHSSSSKKRIFKNIIKGTLRDQDRIIIATSKIAPLLYHKAFVSRLVKRSFDRLEDHLKKEGLLNKEDKNGLALLHITIGVPSESALHDQSDAINTDSLQKEDTQKEGLTEGLRKVEYQPGDISLQPMLPFDKDKRIRLQPSSSNFDSTRGGGFHNTDRRKIQPWGNILSKMSSYISSLREKPLHIWEKLHPFFSLPLSAISSLREKTFPIFFLPAFPQQKKRLVLPSSVRSKRAKSIWIVFLVIIAASFVLFFFEKQHTQSLVLKENTDQKNQLQSEGAILLFKDLKESFDSGFLSAQKAFLFAPTKIYEADTLTKNIEQLSLDSSLRETGLSTSRPLAIVSDINNTFLFLLKEDKKFYVATYKPEQKSITKEVVSWPLQDNASIKDISIYSGNIYVLINGPADTKNKQILKYSKNDLLSPKFWFGEKTKIPLDNPISLTADGSIYILDLPNEAASAANRGGKIIEFRLGKKVRELDLTEQFSSQAKLRLMAKDYLYVVDPENKRFLLIDKKQGKTIKSDTSPSLGEILDILPLQESQELMILTKNGVFKKPFTLPQ